MEASEGTTKVETERGGNDLREYWLEYSPAERTILRPKLLGAWDDLSYLDDYWNVVYDDGDLTQFSRMASTWQLSETGLINASIARKLGLDPGQTLSLLSGKNRRPNLALMYLNHEKLGKPGDGWKWILESTPKPTNPDPKAIQVPVRIVDHRSILEFLEQYPPIPESSEALRFFGLSSAWALEHRAELFWFLLAFLVGDGGKYYSDYSPRVRHYRKTQLTTTMKLTDSNFRVLRYVQLCLEVIGIQSGQTKSNRPVIRWNSDASNILTWMIQVCIGLPSGARTSRNPINMPWLKTCPKYLIVAFLQGLSDSDGNVEKHGYHANISSVPNTVFIQELFTAIGVKSRVHPKKKPQQARVLLKPAVEIPFFNPTIRSYRYDQLFQHAIRRKLIPPPPSFFSLMLI